MRDCRTSRARCIGVAAGPEFSWGCNAVLTRGSVRAGSLEPGGTGGEPLDGTGTDGVPAARDHGVSQDLHGSEGVQPEGSQGQAAAPTTRGGEASAVTANGFGGHPGHGGNVGNGERGPAGDRRLDQELGDLGESAVGLAAADRADRADRSELARQRTEATIADPLVDSLADGFDTDAYNETRAQREARAASGMHPGRYRAFDLSLLRFGVRPFLMVMDALAYFAAAGIIGHVSNSTFVVFALIIVLYAVAGLYRSRLTMSVLDDLPALAGRGIGAAALVTAAGYLIDKSYVNS